MLVFPKELLMVLATLSIASPHSYGKRQKRSLFGNSIFSSVFHNADPSKSFVQRFFEGSSHSSHHNSQQNYQAPLQLVYNHQTPEYVVTSPSLIYGVPDREISKVYQPDTVSINGNKRNFIHTEYGLPKIDISPAAVYGPPDVKTVNVGESKTELINRNVKKNIQSEYGVPKIDISPATVYGVPETETGNVFETKIAPVNGIVKSFIPNEYGVPKIDISSIYGAPEIKRAESINGNVKSFIQNQYGTPKISISPGTVYSVPDTKTENDRQTGNVRNFIQNEYGVWKFDISPATDYGAPEIKTTRVSESVAQSTSGNVRSFIENEYGIPKINISPDTVYGVPETKAVSESTVKPIKGNIKHFIQTEYGLPKSFIPLATSYGVPDIKTLKYYDSETIPNNGKRIDSIQNENELSKVNPISDSSVLSQYPQKITISGPTHATRSSFSYREWKKQHGKVPEVEERTPPENYHLPSFSVLPDILFGGPWRSVAPEHGLPKVTEPRNFLEGSFKTKKSLK